MAIAREIKFRAWDKDGIFNNGTACMHYDITGLNIFDSLWHDDDFPKMQYTGRKDKEDKEIYEDDIIIDSEGRYGLVYWNLDDCQFLVDFQADMEIEQISWTYTVCGNYWENVELLK